jgi:mono/diheme cytochrome c family protein
MSGHPGRCGLAILIVLALLSPALAQTPRVQRGLAFVRTNCAQCHAIDRTSPSPMAIAPPFRNLNKSYPVESLAEAFAEGIRTGHPSMPEFRLDPAQISDVIAFLKSLK